MSNNRHNPSATLYQQQTQRLKSFRSLLDPTDLLPGHNVADLYSLRHLCLQGGGIPDTVSTSADGWLRAQAWRVLLGYLSPEKSEWNRILERRRAEYYQFVDDFLPQHGSTSQQGIPGKLSERDALLDQIYRDLSRSRKNAFAFYRDEVKESKSCPLTPLPAKDSGEAVPRLTSRHSLLQRLETINDDFAYSRREERRSEKGSAAAKEHAAPRTPEKTKETLLTVSNSGPIDVKGKSPSITLEPASPRSIVLNSPGATSAGSDEDDDTHFASADEGDHTDVGEEGSSSRATQGTASYTDRRWHSLLRILYIYALLNPSTGYVQGMNEVLFVLLFVMGTSGHLPSAKPERDDETREEEGESHLESSDEAFLSAADASTSFRYLDHLDESPGSHAEADAFWCFSALVGDIRDLYDFDGIDHAGLKIINKRQTEGSRTQVTGMASVLKKFSLRLKWLDEELYKQLQINSLDPRLPYYSFRWLACLVSTELSLPSIVRVWDAILAESSEATNSGGTSTPKVEFLIDICCALLVNIRGLLLSALNGGGATNDNDEDIGQEDAFGRAMKVLQAYPDDDVGPIVEMACLYRQKRLAAPLTGDGPPSDDEDESLLSVRERAANALKTWTNVSTPSRTSKWLNSTPRTPSTTSSVHSPSSTPSRSTSAALFKRYTEAIQSSDAAANLSKASTNWTAKAMVTWNGSRSNRSGSQTSPLAEMKTSFMNRVASAGTSPSSPNSLRESKQQIHPSLRWSMQSMPPDLPLPNVNDSPPMPSHNPSTQSPLRGYTSMNRLGAGSLNGHNQFNSPDIGYPDSTPGNSPNAGSISKFGTLPSLQGTPRTKIRGAGPKPLLLTGSARPPREGSANGSLAADEPMSRKISSGPLAANVSPRTRRRVNGSASRRDSSYGGSVSSSITGPDSYSNDGYEDGTSTSARSDNAVPNLPSLLAATKDVLPPLPTSAPPLGLQGAGNGTVPASAFSKSSRALTNTLESRESTLDRESNRPAFGQVASSADIPLVSKVTLQRKPHRKESDLMSENVSLMEDGMEDSSRNSVASSNDSRPLRHSQQSWIDGGGAGDVFEHPRQPPVPPQSMDDGGSNQEVIGRVQKYTLSDEPSVVSTTATATTNNGPLRNGSTSSTRSVGITRSKRAYSGKRERGSGGGGRNSLGLGSGSEASSNMVESDLMARGGRESLRLGTIDTNTGLEKESMNLAPLLGTKSKVHSPGIPSPGPEAGKLLPSEELLNRLQLDQGFSGGESSGLDDEGVTPKMTNRDYYAEMTKRQSLTYLQRTDVGFDSDEEEEGGGLPADEIRNNGDYDDQAKEGMAAIGSALAFASSGDEEGDESTDSNQLGLQVGNHPRNTQ